MERYESPLLIEMLKRIRDADPRDIEQQRQPVAFFDCVFNSCLDIIDVDTDNTLEAAKVAHEIKDRFKQELKDFEINW